MTSGPEPCFGPFRLARQHHEARGVVGLVLDVLGQDVETIDLRGEPRGDRGDSLVVAFGNRAGAPAVSPRHDRLDAELADDPAALAERVHMALDRLDVVELGAARRHQLMADRQKPFADDEQAGLRQQMMDVGDAAGDRILDRDHAEIGFARRDRRKRVLEGGAGQRLGVGIGFDDGDMGIRPRLALECDLSAWFAWSWRALYQPLRYLASMLAGGFQIRRRVDPARHGIDDGDVDPHSGLQRPELLELLLLFQRRGRQPDEALQRRAAIGVEADMVVARAVARTARWRG